MAQTYNMTEGKVPKLLLGFFFPMLFTNLLQQIYAIADTAIVGKGLGDNALGAVGNMSPLSLLIIGFSTGLTNGFSVVIAQSYGAGNRLKLCKSIGLSVKLSVVITALLTAASLLSLRSIMIMMNTSELILDDSLRYGYIIFGGLAAAIAYNLCSCILRALGDSRTPFIAIIVSSVMNILLDCIFIFVFQTGVEGAAVATIISQAVSAVICYLKIRKIDIIRLGHEAFEKDGSVYRELLKDGIPMACMNSVTAVGCMVVQAYVNGLGVVYTSAYSACSKYLNLAILPSVTAGFSVSAFTSQNYGAKKHDRIREGVKVGVVIAMVSYLLFGSVMTFLPRVLAKFMLNGEEAVLLAVEYLRICGIALFLVNFLFIFRNCVQGMGYPFVPMCSGILEMVLRIPVIMVFLPVIGFRAAAYAEAAAWIGALGLNVAAYMVLMRKKWQRDDSGVRK